MHVTEPGFAVMMCVEQYILRRDLLGDEFGHTSWLYLLAIVVCCLLGQRPVGGVCDECWVYVTLVMPLYFASLTLIPALTHPLLCCMATVALIIWKVGVCMSVCLHRYAAHNAFRCGPVTSFALHWVGCLANQGGPLWWAANHRCHHRFCDVDRRSSEDPNHGDPHSPVLDGNANAFAFMSRHGTLKEDFCPPFCDNLATRMLDTWSFVPGAIEMYLFHRYLGADGLWVACLASWFSQIMTLWFNVVNHMPDHDDEAFLSNVYNKHVLGGGQEAFTGATNPCRASDRHAPKAPNVFFHIMNQNLWIALLVGEDTHGHHHSFGTLAHRPGYDLPFHVFVRPLRALGLIWRVRTEGRELPSAKPRSHAEAVPFDHVSGCHLEVLSGPPASDATDDSATSTPQASSESEESTVTEEERPPPPPPPPPGRAQMLRRARSSFGKE